MVAQARHRRRDDDDIVTRLQQQASEVGSSLKSSARELKEQAAKQAKQLAKVVRQEADRLVHDQKIRTATKMQSVGSAANKAARFLHAAKVEGVADYVDMAAQQTQRASKYLDDRELGEIADDLADLARRHPAAVFTGMLIAGIAFGRFLKAGIDDQQQED